MRKVEAMLSERWVRLDDAETITAFAQDTSTYLNESELTERGAFIESLVKEIVVSPGKVLIRYSILYATGQPALGPGR